MAKEKTTKSAEVAEVKEKVEVASPGRKPKYGWDVEHMRGQPKGEEKIRAVKNA